MKIILTSFAVLALTSLVQAEAHGKKGGKHGGKKGAPAHVVEKFDVDGDGQLNETERATAKDAREALHAEVKALRNSFDLDGNGELNEAERSEFKTALIAEYGEEFANRLKAKKCKGDCEGKKGGAKRLAQ